MSFDGPRAGFYVLETMAPVVRLQEVRGIELVF
jgi:hypothetical protein